MSKNTFWEDFGKDGHSYQMGQQPHRIKLLNTLNKYRVKSFLDVGCGTGPLYQIIKENGLSFKYKGVDYSSTFIRTAKNLFNEADFEVQDGRNLKEEDESWDAVVLLHALDHIHPHQEVLNSAYRVCKKITLIILWRPFVETEKSNVNSVNKDFEDTHLVDYSKQELDKAIKKAGFTVAEEGQMKEGKYNYMYVLKK